MKTENWIQLDVRSLLALKQDPFMQIMETVSALKPGVGLHLITPFEPVPLFKVMQSKGFLYRTEHISHDEVHTYFEPEP